MGLAIERLDDNSAPAWDAYVAAHPAATFFHQAAWRGVIERSFRQTCHFLYAVQNGDIRGVLPLVHIRSRLFGNSLISTGFTVGGGPLATDDAARAALDQAALSLSDALDVDYLEYRGEDAPRDGWLSKPDLYVVFRKSITQDDEANMLAIPRKQRAMVRKGIKAGLVSEIDATAERLHHIYSVSVRNLGTPVVSIDYFHALKDAFGDACDIVTILNDGAPVASVMNFYFRDQVLPYYGGGVPEARPVAGNDFMYWEVMRRAAARGYRQFDFGRSKRGTGAFSFKKNWGFEPAPLAYQFKMRRGDDLPDINPLNPKYRLFIGAWKRLPLPIANFIGPMVARNLG